MALGCPRSQGTFLIPVKTSMNTESHRTTGGALSLDLLLQALISPRRKFQSTLPLEGHRAKSMAFYPSSLVCFRDASELFTFILQVGWWEGDVWMGDNGRYLISSRKIGTGQPWCNINQDASYYSSCEGTLKHDHHNTQNFIELCMSSKFLNHLQKMK